MSRIKDHSFFLSFCHPVSFSSISNSIYLFIFSVFIMLDSLRKLELVSLFPSPFPTVKMWYFHTDTILSLRYLDISSPIHIKWFVQIFGIFVWIWKRISEQEDIKMGTKQKKTNSKRMHQLFPQNIKKYIKKYLKNITKILKNIKKY